MLLGIDEIHKRIHEGKLLENLSERELTNPEGAGIDLRLGKVFRLSGKGFLGVTERDTPNSELVAEYVEGKTNSFELAPGEYVLTETVETFSMPSDLLAILKPRTTLQRSGIIARMSVVDPGYNGAVHPSLYNAGKETITIEMVARYLNAMFLAVKGMTKRYRGQWQGGRVTTEEKETQI